MPETEPKVNVQAKQHLQMHWCIQNFAKHLEWSKKECFAKIIIAWNYFQKMCDLNTVELLNIAMI